MEVKGQREGSVGQVTHIHTEIALDTGRSWMARVGRSLGRHECGSVTWGKGTGFVPCTASILPFREAILSAEMLSESGWVPEAKHSKGGFVCSRGTSGGQGDSLEWQGDIPSHSQEFTNPG